MAITIAGNQYEGARLSGPVRFGIGVAQSGGEAEWYYKHTDHIEGPQEGGTVTEVDSTNLSFSIQGKKGGQFNGNVGYADITSSVTFTFASGLLLKLDKITP